MNEPEIALLMSTYERPRHLRRALESIALQRGVAGKMELVVTDDGSTDETPDIVREFAQRAGFPVGLTTHPHSAFQLARCRNEGVRASRAAYLLFLDGDCVLPRDHVSVHLARRKPGVVMAGDCCRLDEVSSARLTSDVVSSGEFTAWGDESELRRLKKLDRSSRFYRLIRHPTKPKMIGNNVGIWRADFERINGYDENYQGWGCEDDDLRYRLRKSGVKVESILRWTHTFHLWHPVDSSMPAHWKQGANVRYFLRRGRLTRCRNGLEKRDMGDIRVQVVGTPLLPHLAARFIQDRFAAGAAARPEVEILFLPGSGDFSGQADCNILVAFEADAALARRARRADVLVVAPEAARTCNHPLRFPLEEFDRALAAVA
jgi:glycosyltransferase involved in cell wall biosynthesis